MSQDVFRDLQETFPALKFRQNEQLSQHTYMKTGGPAEVFVQVQTKADLVNLVSWCEKHTQKFIVLGGASNVLVPDEGLKGLVIKNLSNAMQVKKINDSLFELEVDSGVHTNMLVRKALDEGLEGLEYFLGVPGTVGGAIYNNSHYMNQLIGDSAFEVDVVNHDGSVKTYVKNDLQFAYDYSVIQETKETILSIRFRLKKGDKAVLEERALEATRKRASTQPLGIPSTGCMFKNPMMSDGTQGHAGKLIDQAGLKGVRVGDAAVSDKHANFILNTGHANTSDILRLVEQVQSTVKDKFGVELHREVFMLS